MSFIFIFLISAGLAQSVPPISDPRTLATPINCSDKNMLQELLLAMAQHPFAMAELTTERWNKCKTALSPAEKKCFEQLEKHKSTFTTFANSHGLGLPESNQQHWARAQAVDPDSTRPPPGLETGIDDVWIRDYEECRKNKSESADCARFKNFQVVVFNSADCRAVGARVAVVLYKGDKFDKWLLFNSNTADGKGFAKKSYFQQISIQKKDTAGARLAEPIPFWLGYDANSQKLTATGCLSCHSTGLIGLSPIPGTMAAGDSALVSEMNKYRANYGRLNLNTHVKLDDRMPRVGQNRCAGCHGAGAVRSLNPIYSLEGATARVLLGLDMPPKPPKHSVHDFFRAVAKTENLPADARKQVSDQYLKNRATCEPAALLAARRNNLEVLKANGLSEAEYKKASEGLESATLAARETFSDVEREYEGQKHFLAGGSERCILEANGIRQAPPAQIGSGSGRN